MEVRKLKDKGTSSDDSVRSPPAAHRSKSELVCVATMSLVAPPNYENLNI